MAIMIPEKPRTLSPASLEDVMFDSLSMLPDDYYIFHSFKMVSTDTGILHESETDFIIFNRKKGILSLEAKAGHVYYKNGDWFYGSGIRMNHDGPFNQASSNKWKLKNYINKSSQKCLLTKCKLLHAVWFPSINGTDLMEAILPPEADRNILLTEEALADPEPFISRIFEIEVPNHVETLLSVAEEKQLLNNILCPLFNVFPTISLDIDVKKIVFHRLLKEQVGLLNYLEEQPYAVINGIAGTGKTMIAVEKAKRHAAQGEKVLFLCFNTQLNIYLSENYSNENISFYTIDGLACKICNLGLADYARFRYTLEDMFFSGTFPYKHIIIDEGQDFGQEKIEEAEVIKMLQDIVLDESINGTFYIFYDKLQLVQGNNIPRYISEADCKLSLYKNCRNTENIAITSMRPLTDLKPKVFDGCVRGATPRLHFCESVSDIETRIDSIIDKLHSDGIRDIILLTCNTEESSEISQLCVNSQYKKKIRFTSCRKFKGLEADAVILLDMSFETFTRENIKLYYVGASRARFRLDIVTCLSNEECILLLHNYFYSKISPRKPRRELATALNTLYEK